MDSIDRSNSNLPAQFPASPLSRQFGLPPALPVDQTVTPALQIDSKVILRGLIRHWWRILALWMAVSAPVGFLIYLLVQPTYKATSLLRVEPAQIEIFSPTASGRDSGDIRSVPYLETQISLIKSDKVLDPAVADPTVNKLPSIKKSQDPKSDLRDDLVVVPVEGANLISVSLELPNPDEAVAIVKSVVQSYLTQNTEYSRSANRELAESLEQQLTKIRAEIDTKRTSLRERIMKGGQVTVQPSEMLNSKKEDSDSPQPTFKTVHQSQIEKLMNEMVETDLELFNAQSMLEVKQQSLSQADQEDDPSTRDKDLLARITEEFKKDAEVQALLNEIQELNEHHDHAKNLARRSDDPARKAVRDELEKRLARYDALWQEKYKEIRERLTNFESGKSLRESIDELKTKVDVATKKRDKQATLFSQMRVEQTKANDDTYEATYLTQQVNSLLNWEEQVRKHQEQLRFEASQDRYRVVLVDPAAAPKSPSNNKRLKFMAAAPVMIMFMMLGLFVLLEIRAERVADPDVLSTRVRSEVYALPPLPTARSIRKLSASDADDQIEQFIQRLDHLRFAVCGSTAELGKGRCVLITSAIGGEGKTTLSAQLAAHCGNAGMSTVLIDSDFRRAALCPLLDVPEGPGLSDLLKDESTLDEVTIPVQGGTFYLIPAGTPIQDTSRVLQIPKFGQLIGQLRQLYDLIIIDSPPVLPVPDALILGRWADGAVIAARYDISRFPQVERARRQLDNAGIAVLGTVINGMRHSDAYFGRYTYSRRRSNQPDASNMT